MVQNHAPDARSTAGFITSGGSYRATATMDGAPWLCPHVHFTPQSARTCGEQHLITVAKRAERGPIAAQAANGRTGTPK